MTEKEMYRNYVIQQFNDKRITQIKAAELLKISDRQVRNLLHILKESIFCSGNPLTNIEISVVI